MGTLSANEPAPFSSRLQTWLPRLGFAAWGIGAVALWAYAQQVKWSPGELVFGGCVWFLVMLIAARRAVRNLFGPVFAYEMLRIGRRKLTHILRGLYVLGVMALLALMYMTWLEDVGYFRSNGPAQVPTHRLASFATDFFYTFISLQFTVVVLLTPAYVAGAISDEKERKTLEFLLATDLENREIVFGKLAARVGTLLMYILAGLPVIAFMQLFGGIDPDLLLAATTVTVITVLGLSALGICLSVMVKRARDAIALTYLLAVVYSIASPLIAGYIRFGLVGLGYSTIFTVWGTTLDIADATDWLAAGHIGWVVMKTSAAGVGGPATGWVGDALGRYAIFWGVVSTVLLLIAVARLRIVALRQSYGEPRKLRKRAAKTRPVVGDDAMFWKEVFVESGVRGGCAGTFVSIAILGLTFVVPLIIVLFHFGDWIPYVRDWLKLTPFPTPFRQRWEDFVEGMSIWGRIATGIISTLAMLAATVRGASSITGERDRDTWISLASTPISSWDILAGKFWGCVFGLRKVYTVLLLIWGINLAIGAIRPVMLPAMVLSLVVYVAGFAWIGIFCSVTARTSMIATVRAILSAVFLAGGFWLAILFCCVFPIGVFFRGGGPDNFLDDIAQLLLGCTPPFVMGWLPLDSFERWQMEPFSLHDRPAFGPLAPFFGVCIWAVLSCTLAWMSWTNLRTQMNRDAQVIRFAPAPRRLPIAKRVE